MPRFFILLLAALMGGALLTGCSSSTEIVEDGEQAMAGGNCQKAERYWKKILLSNRHAADHWRAYEGLGKCERQANDFRVAILRFEKAIELAPTSKRQRLKREIGQTHLDAALDAESRNDYDSAITSLSTAISENPRFEEARRVRLRIYRKQAIQLFKANEIRQSAAKYQKILEERPDTVEPNSSLVRGYLQMGRDADARDDCYLAQDVLRLVINSSKKDATEATLLQTGCRFAIQNELNPRRPSSPRASRDEAESRPPVSGVKSPISAISPAPENHLAIINSTSLWSGLTCIAFEGAMFLIDKNGIMIIMNVLLEVSFEIFGVDDFSLAELASNITLGYLISKLTVAFGKQGIRAVGSIVSVANCILRAMR